MGIQDRLSDLADEIARLRREVEVLAEQIEHQASVADDARLRALVSETPLSERESRTTADDLARLERSRDDALARIEALRLEVDTLLDGMSAERDAR